jgi:hypothetical protein
MRPTPWQARSGLSRGNRTLAPDLVRHLTREIGASGERVRGEVRALAARVTA